MKVISFIFWILILCALVYLVVRLIVSLVKSIKTIIQKYKQKQNNNK